MPTRGKRQIFFLSKLAAVPISTALRPLLGTHLDADPHGLALAVGDRLPLARRHDGRLSKTTTSGAKTILFGGKNKRLKRVKTKRRMTNQTILASDLTPTVSAGNGIPRLQRDRGRPREPWQSGQRQVRSCHRIGGRSSSTRKTKTAPSRTETGFPIAPNARHCDRVIEWGSR